MKHLKSLFVILAAMLGGGVSAQSVDTVAVWSESMKKDIKNVVITPAAYQTDKDARFPVVYLLHGATGDYTNWIEKAPFLPELASRYGMIIVCPDGNTHSWYWDAPCDRLAGRAWHYGALDGRTRGVLPGVPPSGPLRGLRFDERRAGHPVVSGQ